MDEYPIITNTPAPQLPGDHDVLAFIALIREASEVLRQEKDLSPANPIVTRMIERITAQLRLNYTHDEVKSVLTHTDIQHLHAHLRGKLSEAESQAELFESRRLRNSAEARPEIITQLHNWRVYEALVGQELHLFNQFSKAETTGTPIVFVGSGPLPLSAIYLHLYGHMKVVCLDIDPAACEASRSLLSHIGLEENVIVIQEDGATFEYPPHCRVIVASLVRNKLPVLEQIRRTSPDSLVAVRTAEGIRQLMYESIDEQLLQSLGWELLDRTSPQNNLVINSTLLYKHSKELS